MSGGDVVEATRRVHVARCPRCGGQHGLICKRLLHASPAAPGGQLDLQWWATCPKTGQPILIGVDGGRA